MLHLLCDARVLPPLPPPPPPDGEGGGRGSEEGSEEEEAGDGKEDPVMGAPKHSFSSFFFSPTKSSINIFLIIML